VPSELLCSKRAGALHPRNVNPEAPSLTSQRGGAARLGLERGVLGRKVGAQPGMPSWGRKTAVEKGIQIPAGAERVGGPARATPGRRKWAPKKEVRNCGGGSRPWKRRGKGEARMERPHFGEGRARAAPTRAGGDRASPGPRAGGPT
jgi:hypothetical protein